MFDLLHTPFGLGKKGQTLKLCRYVYFIELSDLKSFGYDQSDTKDRLRCLDEWDLCFVVNILSS